MPGPVWNPTTHKTETRSRERCSAWVSVLVTRQKQEGNWESSKFQETTKDQKNTLKQAERKDGMKHEEQRMDEQISYSRAHMLCGIPIP